MVLQLILSDKNAKKIKVHEIPKTVRSFCRSWEDINKLAREKE